MLTKLMFLTNILLIITIKKYIFEIVQLIEMNSLKREMLCEWIALTFMVYNTNLGKKYDT